MRIKVGYNLKRYLQVACGTLIGAISVNTFLIPHHFLSGGVSGLALISHYLFNLPVGVMIVLLNIPLFIWAGLLLERDFLFIGAFGMVAFSIGVDATQFLREVHFVDDAMLAAIYGGVLSGFGNGLVFRVENGNAGGADIPGRILRKQYSFNLGTVLFAINMVIVLFSSFLFGVKPAMLTLISMFISASLLDKTIEGFDRKKVVFIISDRPQEIADAIMTEIGRGVTFLHGEGAYTRYQKELIYCVVGLTQLARIKKIVVERDQHAFMTVQDAAEVLGQGFRPSM